MENLDKLIKRWKEPKTVIFALGKGMGGLMVFGFAGLILTGKASAVMVGNALGNIVGGILGFALAHPIPAALIFIGFAAWTEIVHNEVA